MTCCALLKLSEILISKLWVHLIYLLYFVYLDGFQFLALMSIVAHVNVLLRVSRAHVHKFLEVIYLKNCRIVRVPNGMPNCFPKCLKILHSKQLWMRVPLPHILTNACETNFLIIARTSKVYKEISL